jgi:predicted exporter
MTTLLAYVVLSFTPFPGFKQIAVFSMVGLSAAWVTSILLLPRLPALNAEPAIRALGFIGKARSYVQSQHAALWHDCTDSTGDRQQPRLSEKQ